jgi:hypothetical protein
MTNPTKLPEKKVVKIDLTNPTDANWMELVRKKLFPYAKNGTVITLHFRGKK